MFRKILISVISAFLIVNTVIFTAGAQEQPQLEVESIEAAAGESIFVDVYLTGNPGIWGIDAAIAYDNTYFDLIGVTNGEVFGSGELTVGNLEAAEYILSFECSEIANVTGNGVLATLEFAVSADTPEGDYPITLSYRDGDIINVDEQLVDFEIVNGAVTVTTKEEDEAKAVLEVEKVTAEAGDTFTVDVSFRDNPGIWGLNAVISYNSEYFELIEVSNGEIFEDNALTIGDLTSADYVLSFECAEIANVTGSGVLAVLTFKAADDAPDGTYPITVSYSNGDIINVDEQLVKCDTADGSITVETKGPSYDVNVDNTLDTEDVIIIESIISGSIAGAPGSLEADADGDGRIGMYDLNRMMSYIRSLLGL